MQPLRNNLFVKIDESLPTESGIYLPVNTDKWREANDQLANRGIVIQVGAGNRHPKTGVLMSPQCKPGDVVRFSELEYPVIGRTNGEKLIIINDQDVVGIEQ
jgi:co-chaperonin GroES (HSP10)